MDWLKNLLGKAGRWISSNIFGDSGTSSSTTEEITPEPQQTLNQQIANGTINQPSTQTNTETTTGFQSGFSDIFNSPQTVSTPEVEKADVYTEGFLDPQEQLTEKTGRELVAEVKKEEEKSLSEKWSDTKASINRFLNDFVKGQKADSDYQSQEKKLAVGYNKDNGDVYYLDLDDYGLSQESAQQMFGGYYNDFAQKVSTPGITSNDYLLALKDFYDNTKDLFTVRGDDFYSDGLFFNDNGTRIGRRKDLYSEEQLDELAKSNVSLGDKPTFEQWYNYLNLMSENSQAKQDIYAGYGLTGDSDSNVINLSQAASEKWHSGFETVAMDGLDDLVNDKVGTINGQARNKLIQYFDYARKDQEERIYNIVSPVYSAEQVVLAKSPSERTEGEKKTLEYANKLRKMEKEAAKGFNNWARQNLLYAVDENGDITRVLDIFENGESLNDVLTKGVKEASGEDWALESHQSNIDIFSKVANDALYNYNKGKGSGVRPAWNWLEHSVRPVGDWLGETGQFIAGTLSNIYSITTQAKDSTLSSYLDQDFTVGMLIETNDSNITRTLKKYMLQGVEYVPEGVGNLLPDIALIVATSGGGAGFSAARWATKFPKLVKALRVAEGTNWINKWRNAKRAVDIIDFAKGAEAIKDLSNIAKTSELGTKAKMWLEILDNAVTQGTIGQLMDAQWSAYDTEPYSNASFWLSILGTGIGDIGVELARGRALTGLLRRSGQITGTFWDLADFIDSSDEAAEAISKVFGKSAKDLSLEELKTYAKSFGAIEDAAKQVYEGLSEAGQVAANKWNKEIMYNYVVQAYGSNSEIAKNVRRILTNGSTNVADMMKYLGKIPGDVTIGPYISTIRLKNGTLATASAVKDSYDIALDVATGGFDNKLKNGFTQSDINKISKLTDYSDVIEDSDKLFFDLDGKKFLTDEGLKRFGIKVENAPLESLGVSLADAENVREIFKDKMKGLSNKKISDTTVDRLADTGGYEEIVTKVKEVLGC